MAARDETLAPEASHLLVKLRPSAALRAAEARVPLEPLYPPRRRAPALGLEAEPQWFLAELPADARTPWDLAHGRIADRMGVAPSDVLFAEPDLVHRIYRVPDEPEPGRPFAVGEDCTAAEQDPDHGKAVGPEDVFAWHLGDEFTQLGTARQAVDFASPRTRIAHVDTGYFPDHVTTPEGIRPELGRSFVRGEEGQGGVDVDNRRYLLDNTGHGAGTVSLLAGGGVPAFENAVLGGAPQAEVVPLRVAESVVLLRTSSLARALRYALEDAECDVLTLSMGGLPSRAWAEAVDAAYEGGLVICAAAGNHVGLAPPRTMVYPARYPRVIGVCGVMADGRPYADLDGFVIEGSFGPESAMRTALATYTPNVPWARFGCPEIVRLNGQGTSAATPQVAAAAALWLEKHKGVLPQGWRRVEAVRNALFTTAGGDDPEHFGRGVLRANDALAVRPVLGLPKSERSRNSFAFFRLITGLGVAEPPPRERMFSLELAQRLLENEALQELVPHPEAVEAGDQETLLRVMEAVIEDDGASDALRKHLVARYAVLSGRPAPRTERSAPMVPEPQPVARAQPVPGDPPHRRLRVYAVDPSLSTRLATVRVHETTLQVRWEDLEPGPVGEYLAVEDVDATGTRYEPVDLDDPRLLALDGWAPSEGNPQFHQQMVYAVAMKTIEHFERALGRPVLWRPEPKPGRPYDDSGFVRTLKVSPHALHQANAFYSPREVALQFGYFEAEPDDPGEHMPGSRVYSCLSHDIVAHETTHAILDGMHPRFNEATNVDVLAFHEAFADAVALLQHFTVPELLEHEIARTRGDVETESLLGALAVQFGRATGARGALRNAIGRMEDGAWKRLEPDPRELARLVTPHARGAVLVAAVFDAFLAVYRTRTADLFRLATGGTGELPEGAIHPDLVRRLAAEASKSARHVLTMCIRALDYVPPVDLTFFEYLRALITADFDLVSDDRYNYRVAFVEAFRRRGIYPLNLQEPTRDTPRSLSVETLRWQGLDRAAFPKKVRAALAGQYAEIVAGLQEYADTCFYLGERETLFKETRRQRQKLQKQLKAAFASVPEFAEELGLDPGRSFEVHALHRALRSRTDGSHVPQVVVALTQSKTVRASKKTGTPKHVFRGGSTLVVDLTAAAGDDPFQAVKYRIVKHIGSTARQERTAAFFRDAASDPLRGLFTAPDAGEPFAALHALTG